MALAPAAMALILAGEMVMAALVTKAVVTTVRVGPTAVMTATGRVGPAAVTAADVRSRGRPRRHLPGTGKL